MDASKKSKPFFDDFSSVSQSIVSNELGEKIGILKEIVQEETKNFIPPR